MRPALAVALLLVGTGCSADVTFFDGCAADSSCPEGMVCVEGACVVSCTPLSCAEAGLQCGWVSDACGHELFCGECPEGLVCDGRGACGSCVPLVCAELGLCGLVRDGCGGEMTCECEDGFSCQIDDFGREEGFCCSLSCEGIGCGERNGCGQECWDLCPHWVRTEVQPLGRWLGGAGAVSAGGELIALLQDQGQVTSDWQFDGLAWEALGLWPGPVAHPLAAAADQAGGVLVVAAEGGEIVTWRWSTRWERLTTLPTTSPFDFTNVSLATSARLGEVILWTCQISPGCSTWRWNGTQWDRSLDETWIRLSRIVDGPDGEPLRFGLTQYGSLVVWAWNSGRWIERSELRWLPTDELPVALHRASGTVVAVASGQTWYWDGGEWRSAPQDVPGGEVLVAPVLLPLLDGGLLALDGASAFTLAFP